MKDKSQEPISREVWYLAQKSMADNIKEVKEHAVENRKGIKEISADVKKLVIQTTIANGRTAKLEDWAIEAKADHDKYSEILSHHDKSITEALSWKVWMLPLLTSILVGLIMFIVTR
jgi:hypothetical protein